MRIRVVLLVLAVAAAAALPLGASARRHAAEAPCASNVRRGVLPVWMRGGFSGANPRIPYVVGAGGRIGAILFGAPLNAPPAKTKNNKILWVSRQPWNARTALWIRMQRMDGARLVGAPVHRIVAGGPGPSYVNAPSAGCWRLTLSWAGRRDTLDLEYVAPTN